MKNNISFKMSKRGLNPIQQFQAEQIAKRQSKELEKEAYETAFVNLMILPCLILLNDYWHKASRTKVKQFVKSVLSAYDSWGNHTLTDSDLTEVFKDLTDFDYAELLKEILKEREVKKD